jgi:hypothetical protein
MYVSDQRLLPSIALYAFVRRYPKRGLTRSNIARPSFFSFLFLIGSVTPIDDGMAVFAPGAEPTEGQRTESVVEGAFLRLSKAGVSNNEWMKHVRAALE